jgi:hypothetical protein|tara:strand:- start:362 stop:763 length:402 start_codon:yes stop_codon:yes gene_type:complete
MGINSQNVAYGFGQMGSGHIKAAASDLIPPHGRVIVAITMLDAVKFDQLVADDSFASSLVDQTDPDTRGDGVAFFGTATQTRANGLDQSDSSVESVVVANDVEFPKGLTIYGRWTRVSLQADSTHGIICYYGE